MYGNYDSQVGSTLVLSLVRCQDKADQGFECKAEREIDEYLNGQYLIVVENTQKFQKLYYNEESIVNQSSISWIDIHKESRISYVR